MTYHTSSIAPQQPLRQDYPPEENQFVYLWTCAAHPLPSALPPARMGRKYVKLGEGVELQTIVMVSKSESKADQGKKSIDKKHK